MSCPGHWVSTPQLPWLKVLLKFSPRCPSHSYDLHTQRQGHVLTPRKRAWGAHYNTIAPSRPVSHTNHTCQGCPLLLHSLVWLGTSPSSHLLAVACCLAFTSLKSLPAHSAKFPHQLLKCGQDTAFGEWVRKSASLPLKKRKSKHCLSGYTYVLLCFWGGSE